MELIKRKIFNPLGDDTMQARSLIGGNPTGIANFNSVKYKWASSLYTIMVNNFWIPEKVSLVDDRVTIKELTPDELNAFKNTLSFLIALDSMQTANLPKLADYITAPEVEAIFTVQTFQELIHSQSYQYMLQELFPTLEREVIYNYWRTNPLLLERNTFIADQYEKFNQEQTIENYKLALAADFALEGIYFYNGFNFFYQLAARNKCANISKIIKYIENDEQCLVGSTEVLTWSGWKSIKDVSLTDKVCQYDTETGDMRFVQPTNLTHTKVDTLYSFTGDNYSQVVSENHRMIVKNIHTSKVTGILAKDIQNSDKDFLYVVSGDKLGEEKYFKLSDIIDQIKFTHGGKEANLSWLLPLIYDMPKEEIDILAVNFIGYTTENKENQEVIDLINYFTMGSFGVWNDLIEVEKLSVNQEDVYCLTVPGSAFVIRHNDKISVTGNCHVSFMVSLIREVFDMSSESDKDILRTTLMQATEQEIAWGHEIYGDRILGISKKSTTNFVKYLANQRAKVIGLGVLYKGFSENPYAYLDQQKRENFFETKVVEYSQSTAVDGWDNF